MHSSLVAPYFPARERASPVALPALACRTGLWPRDTTSIVPPRCAPGSRRPEPQYRRAPSPTSAITKSCCETTYSYQSNPRSRSGRRAQPRADACPTFVLGDYKDLTSPVSRRSDRGGRIDPGDITGLELLIASNAKRAPQCGVLTAGVDPPKLLTDVAARVRHDGAGRCPGTARPRPRPHSERCCGMPARRARTSVSRYRRWPPSVRIDVSFPAFAHLVTVLGSTRNIVATSAGVSSGSASGVRADIMTASPPGPVV